MSTYQDRSCGLCCLEITRLVYNSVSTFVVFVGLLLVLPSVVNASTVAQFTGGEFYYDGNTFATASSTNTQGTSQLDAITNPAPFNFTGSGTMTLDIQGVTSNSGWIVSGPVGYQTFTGGTFTLSDGSGVLLQGTIGNSALSAPAGSDPQVATIFSFNAINYSTISANLNTGLSAPLPGSYSISMQFLGSYSTPTSNAAGGLSAFNTTGTGTFNAVPVPPAVWLFGTGLLGLVAVARRRKTD